MWIVLYQKGKTDFVASGPFHSEADAIDYAESKDGNPWVVKLDNPREVDNDQEVVP